MKILYSSAITLLCSIYFTYGQVTTFQKVFGYTDGSGQWLDNANGVFSLQDSTILVLSFSVGINDSRSKVVTNGFSKEGLELFEKAYGKDSVYYFIGQSGTMTKTINADFAVAGSGGINLIDTWATLWVFNSNGDSLLQKDYGSLGNSDTLENFYDLVQLADSGFMMVGWKELSPTLFPIPEINPNLYLVRVDKEGILLWQKEYDESFDDEGLHIELFDSTHVIIAGYKHEYNSPNDTPWVFVTDLAGNIVKERSFTEPPYNCYAAIGPRLSKGIDENFIFSGCLNGALQNGFFEYPLYLAKMDTNLNFIWQKDFNSANVIYIYHTEQMQDSSIMVVGYQQDSITGRVWGWVSKLDNNGNVIWDKLYKQGNSFINYLYDIDQTYDCGFVVSGSMNTGDQQSWLLKMDKYGCINPVCDTSASSCGIGFPTSNSQSQSVSTMQLDASIYPNPASDVLSVFYSLPQGSNTAQLIIYNINGSKVYEEKLYRSVHEVSVDVSALAGGVYVCEIKTQKEILTKKLLVAR
ncbi:MAG: T9SS type A sorting domain-containing protein [Chitinophagales bacterium]|nr:T9SS type A sorting domain-containing protein [Chitinophagales bacterium]